MRVDTKLLLGKVRKFGIVDFTLMKLALVSIGLVFGAIFSSFVLEYMKVFIGVFSVSFIYLAVRLFFIKESVKESVS